MSQIYNGAITLKVFTEKSMFTFGIHSGQTVGDVIRKGHLDYIAWVYYNLANISFSEQILSGAKIVDRITKPSKNLAFFKSWRERYSETAHIIHNKFQMTVRTPRVDKRRNTPRRSFEHIPSKAFFMYRNQGHKNY
jgi:hypothetical protein